MDDNERKDDIESQNENNFNNQQDENQNEQNGNADHSTGYSSQYNRTENGYGNNGYRPQNNNGYNGYRPNYDNRSRGYYSPSNYGNGSSAATKSSKKLIIISISIVAAVLIAAIVGLVIFYNNVLKPLIGDIDGGLGGGQGGLPTGMEMIDEDFDLTQPSTPGTPFNSLPDAYDDTYKIFAEINVSSEKELRIGAGSGFILARMKNNKGYYIVTNNHVVEGMDKITVKLYNGKTYGADETVLRDPRTDLAVIAIYETEELPVAKLGKSSNLRVGEDVYLIGNALGTFTGTLSNGIISSKAEELYFDPYYMTLLQTTAAVNPGCSGGPLFNMAGEVIGIANASINRSDVYGISFAIPMDTAINVIEQMIRKGYVDGRHNLGIQTAQDPYGVGGLWITGLDPASPLVKAGLPMNNLYAYQINTVDGWTFNSSVQLHQYFDSLQPGDTVTISLNVYEMTFSSFVPVEQKTYTVTLGQKLATD